MAEAVKKATRESYGEALAEIGAENDRIVVFDADLSGSTKTSSFAKQFPERFFNVGIAEGNMMGIAAGAAAAGLIPFASSFAMFAAGRAFEQVRNSIGYPHLNVKIGATHAGLSVGEDGASHQCNEDIALMCAIPGMTVICPSDDAVAKAAVRAAAAFYGPVYLRFGRMAVPAVYAPGDFTFEIGKAIEVKSGDDVTVIATGLMVFRALEAAKRLEAEGIGVRVVDMHTIKPLDRDCIVRAAKETGAIVTAEEHSVVGGLGAAVAGAVTETVPVPVLKVGVNDTFGESGASGEILEKYGLTVENIAENCKKAIAMKHSR